MGDVKMHYQRLRLDVRYPGKPDRGQPEPAPGTPVHFQWPTGRVACGIRGAGMRRKTRLITHITCPHCLRTLNLPAPSQRPPCESPAGSATLSAESAQGLSAKKPSIIMQCPRLVVPPHWPRLMRGFYLGVIKWLSLT